jgi:carbon storage regulator CsrA
MLVLARKHNESVAVGGNDLAEPLLVVTVLQIKSRTVLLGFEAKGDIPVHRWEVWKRIAADTPLQPRLRPDAAARAHGSSATTCAKTG